MCIYWFRRAAVSFALLGLVFCVPGIAWAGQAGLSASESSQQVPAPIRVQPSPQLFATLCAVYAAGYANVPANLPPQLQQIVAKMQALHDPSVEALRAFYAEHQLSTPTATFSRYVSFAMVVGSPPGFEFNVPTEGVPPDVLELNGFQDLLANFYRQEHIGRLWHQVLPLYQADANQLRGPVANMVLVAKGYARRMNDFEPPREFVVNVDPLVGPLTNFRIYSEQYEIAVAPGATGIMDEIRHAFLHFLLDPLPFNEQNVVDRIRYLQYYAREAPRLSNLYKYDFVAFTDECFVRAVELHLRHLSPAELAGILDRDDRNGYVLVRPIYEALDRYQRSQVSLADYFPTLLGSINVKLEGQREAHIAFLPAPDQPVTPKEAEADQIARLLTEGNRDIALQQEKQAIGIFQGVLKLDPKSTRAMYGLAVALALTGQGASSHELFDKIVHTPAGVYVDPSVMAWSHVYLGRMNDLAGRRQQAVSHYHEALAVQGIPPAAREAAESGVNEPYTPGKTDAGKASH